MLVGKLFTLAIAAGTVSAYGCANCLGQDVDSVKSGCVTYCGQAFGSTTSAYRACSMDCKAFVVTEKCCDSSCSTSANTCLTNSVGLLTPSKNKRDIGVSREESRAQLEKIRSDPDSFNLRSFLAREPPYDAVETTKELRSLHPSLARSYLSHDSSIRSADMAISDIEKRGPGQTCCNAAQAILTLGTTKVSGGVLGGQWGEQQWEGLVIIAFGTASAYACHLVFQMSCSFFNNGVAPAIPPGIGLGQRRRSLPPSAEAGFERRLEGGGTWKSFGDPVRY